jgi:hypothetical protein
LYVPKHVLTPFPEVPLEVTWYWMVAFLEEGLVDVLGKESLRNLGVRDPDDGRGFPVVNHLVEVVAFYNEVKLVVKPEDILNETHGGSLGFIVFELRKQTHPVTSGITTSFAPTDNFELRQPESFCRKKRFQAFFEPHVAELRKWRDGGSLRVGCEVGDYLCKRRNGLGGVRGL